MAAAVEYTDCISAEEKGYPPNGCPGHDTKQSDTEAPEMLELYGMQGTPSLPSLPGQLCPGVVSPDRVLAMGQMELNCVFMFNWIARNRSVLISKLPIKAKLNCLK